MGQKDRVPQKNALANRKTDPATSLVPVGILFTHKLMTLVLPLGWANLLETWPGSCLESKSGRLSFFSNALNEAFGCVYED